MRRIADISTGFLRARTIADALLEMTSLNLETDASEYLEKYKGEPNNIAVLKHLVPVHKAFEIVRAVLPDYGKATGYEKVLQYYDNAGHQSVPVRLVEWHLPLDKACDLAKVFKAKQIAYYTASNGRVYFYTPEKCFLQNLYKFNNIEQIQKANDVKYAALMKNRKIRDVRNKLDKKDQ